MLTRILMLLLIVGVVPKASADLYSKEELNNAYNSMGHNIQLMLTTDIPKVVPRSLRLKTNSITSEFRLEADHPLSFYADPVNAKVYIPMESVLFFDELAIVSAWLTSKRCDPISLSAYLATLLRYKSHSVPPLKAFGISQDDARSDEFVWDVSGKDLKSMLLFVLSHEVGHILLEHKGGVSGPYSQEQEIEADSFAMDIYAKIGVPPYGMVLYLMAARWLDPVGSSVKSHSHPIANERQRAIANRMLENPEEFSESAKSTNEPDQQAAIKRIKLVAAELLKIAETSADEELLTVMPEELAKTYTPAEFKNACI